jgi:hypothetical protein
MDTDQSEIAAWQRSVAGIVDGVPLGGSGIYLARRLRAQEASVWRRRITVAAAQAAYIIVPTAIFGGTPGQLVVGLRVVDAKTGRRPSPQQVILRWALNALPPLVVRMVLTNPPPRDEPAPENKARGRMLRAAGGIVLLAVYRKNVNQQVQDRLTNTKLVAKPRS